MYYYLLVHDTIEEAIISPAQLLEFNEFSIWLRATSIWRFAYIIEGLDNQTSSCADHISNVIVKSCSQQIANVLSGIIKILFKTCFAIGVEAINYNPI